MQWKLSPKHKKILTWWTKDSPVKNKDICLLHGAIRSGKTFIGLISYILWCFSFGKDNDYLFGFAGQTIGSFLQNCYYPTEPILEKMGMTCNYSSTLKIVNITYKKKVSSLKSLVAKMSAVKS